MQQVLQTSNLWNQPPRQACHSESYPNSAQFHGDRVINQGAWLGNKMWAPRGFFKPTARLAPERALIVAV
jgi:hypothetical protein